MNDFKFLDEEKFMNAYLNKKATIFINMPMPEIYWEEVLDFVSENQNDKILKKVIPNPHSFCYNEAQRISKVNLFVKEVHSRFELGQEDPRVITCQLFGSMLLGEDQTFPKHMDSENNLFWQGKGKVRWRLYDSMDNDKPFMDVILEENDLLYIPAKTPHYVESITPRFSFATLFKDRK